MRMLLSDAKSAIAKNLTAEQVLLATSSYYYCYSLIHTLLTLCLLQQEQIDQAMEV